MSGIETSSQHYYRWLANPVSPGELNQACRANALFDVHVVDPGFGYQFLVALTRDLDLLMVVRIAGRSAQPAVGSEYSV